jgi:hypothetical protein
MSTTRLAYWSLGPAYYQTHPEENPECFVCAEPIDESQHCEGCGSGICGAHSHHIRHVAFCQWCFADAKQGRS